MATATLSPSPGFLGFVDINGEIVPGGLVYTYLAGTTTPATTYSDATISVPNENSNPVVIDADGRCVIYLVPGMSYKYVFRDADGGLIWSRDNIAAVGNAATAANQHGVVQGRMSLTSGLPVTQGDVLAATSVKWVPYIGNQISLYDGAAWALYQFSELSLSITGFAADTLFDLFALPSGATATLSSLAWNSSSARAVALTTQDGALVKTGDPTMLYLGTFSTTAVIGQTEDSFLNRLVWNYYNRVDRVFRVSDATASWTYNTAAYRQANGATANKVRAVIGVQEVMVKLQVVGMCAQGTGDGAPRVSIGEDSTTVPSTAARNVFGRSGVANGICTLLASIEKTSAVGIHSYTWLEYGGNDSTSTTWIGTDAGLVVTGMNGSFLG